MKKLKMVILCGISMISTMSFANGIESEKDSVNSNNRNGDSVMTPGTMVKPALTAIKKNQGTSTNYTPNQEIEYNLTNCPSGYSNGGSSSFRTGQRLTTSFYHNGQLMKTTKSDWLPVNESCTGTEDQTVSCPSGYTGNVQQQRTVTYNTSGYNYGNWSDTSNSCVLIPPVTPPAPVSCSNQTTYVVTSRDYQEYDYAFTCVYDIYKEVSVNGMCKNTLIGSDSWVQYGGWFNCEDPLNPVTPPESTSRQWYQTENWSEYDAYAYSGASRVYYGCGTAYGRKTIRIYYGGGNGSVIQGMAELEKEMSPGGACYCDEKSPNGGYSIEGIGGDYACWTNKEIEAFEAAKYADAYTNP